MQSQIMSYKKILVISLFGLLICLISFIREFNNKSTLIVFCNVGQGDATYIRVNNGLDILVDAGPSRAVLSCLGKHMPFFDKNIEVAILSHPQKDHYMGFEYITNRYSIENFFLPPLESEDKHFRSLMKKLQSKKTVIRHIQASRLIKAQNSLITFLWPSNQYLEKINSDKKIPFFNRTIDPNDISGILTFTQNDTTIYLTGDAPAWVLEELQTKHKISPDIFKMAHHGSKTSINRSLLLSINPKIAIISCGKSNRYKHPSGETLKLLVENNIKYYRTDNDGEVVFKLRKNKIYKE